LLLICCKWLVFQFNSRTAVFTQPPLHQTTLPNKGSKEAVGWEEAKCLHRSQVCHTATTHSTFTRWWKWNFIHTCHVYKLFTFFLSFNNFYFGFHSLIMNLFLLFHTLSVLLYFPDIIRVYIFFIKCNL
jgi:hypothetical protein